MTIRFHHCASLILLIFSIVAMAGPIHSQEQPRTSQASDLNLVDPKIRNDFLIMFGMIPRVNICAMKANIAVGYMRERDSGIELKNHLWVLRQEYENEKITLRQYVDEQRVVNDVHRTRTARTGGGFLFTDPNEMWSHQFKFCFQPSYHY